jgi:hypothetical protein
VSSCVAEERRGFGDKAKNPDCKQVLLRPGKTSAVISPGTSNKVNDLQDLGPPGPAVRQLNVSANKKGKELIARI